MGRPNTGGHVRTLGGTTQYRLIRIGYGPQILEHRYIMEQHLGRKLLTSEIVHHIDGDGLNNDLSNLELMSQSDHRREHSGPFNWDLAEGIRLKNEGFTVTEIARQLGVSQPSISQAFIRRGIPTYTSKIGQHRKLDWDLIISLFNDGLSKKDIAGRFGVSTAAIRNVINRSRLYNDS